MLDEVSVEISQVGKTGRTVFETDLGLSFVAQLEHTPHRVVNGRKIFRPREKMVRRIELMAPCHGVVFEAGNAKDRNGNKVFCRTCRAPSPWGEEYIFSLSEEGELAQDQFVKALRPLVEDDFAAILIASGLVRTVETVWAQIRKGERISSILKISSTTSI